MRFQSALFLGVVCLPWLFAAEKAATIVPRRGPTRVDEARWRAKQERLRRKLERNDNPQGAAEHAAMKRRIPGTQTVPVERYAEAIEKIRRMERYSTSLREFLPSEAEVESKYGARGARDQREQLGTWEPLGPGNIGGRVRSLLIHPTTPTTMYTGGAAGGVWKTTNGGALWTPVSDLLANIAITSLAMDRNAPDTLYAGTGEGFGNFDAVRGAGIFKTTNGGASWTHLASTAGNSNFFFVNDIVISGSNSQRLYAATGTGVFRSTDGGASWTRVLQSTESSGCLDLAIRTDLGTDTVFAACGGSSPARLYRNTDAGGGGTWEVVLSDPRLGRMSLAVAPSNQAVIYVLAACGNPQLCGNFFNGMWAVYRSTQGGAVNTFTVRVDNRNPTRLNTLLLSNVEAAACFNPPGIYNQGWYDNVIAVDPTNPDTVWAGGINLFRSTDGAQNWQLASYWAVNKTAPQYNHADQHVIVFHPQYNGTSNRILYTGGDGGIFRTDNALAAGANDAGICNVTSQIAWISLNNSLGVTQFYHGLPYPNGATYFGGTQDNGTIRGSDGAPNAWTEIRGGDGGYVAVDPNNTNILYSNYVALSVEKSTNGGASWTKATSGIDNPTLPNGDTNFLFIMPMHMDPTNAQRLYVGGRHLWRTDNGATFWTQASREITHSGSGSGKVSAIASAASNANRVLVGTGEGWIHRLDNATSSNSTTPWVSLTRPRSGYVSWLAFDPNNANLAYATYASFNQNAGDAHVYRSTDGGTNWSPIDGSGATGLPDVPAHCLVVDPGNGQRLYVGTDVGVFVSLDGGATWVRENTGFANVVTESLSIISAGGTTRLYAFTHGRGAWRVPLGNFCSYTINPASRDFNASAGTGTVSVIAGPGCAWQATSNANWITVTGGASGTGNGTVSFSITANTGTLPRTGTITIAGRTFTVHQAAANCTYQLNPTSASYGAAGGNGSVSVTTQAGCAWTATSNDGWLTITSGAGGSGSGTVQYTAAVNPLASPRNGTLTIAGINFPINQSGSAGGVGNDEATGATLVSTFPYVTSQDTRNATANPSDPVHSCTQQRDSATVWYRLTPNFSGTVQAFTSGSTYNTVLAAYTGSTAPGTELACNDDVGQVEGVFDPTSTISFTVTSGQSYLIQISGAGPASLGGTLQLTISANDQVTAATPIISLPASFTQDISAMTLAASDPVHSCTGSQDSKSVWFRYTAAANGRITANTMGSNYDTVLAVYPGTTSPGAEIICVDDEELNFGISRQSAVGFAVTAGQSYLIRVSAYANSVTTGRLRLEVESNDLISGATQIGSVPAVIQQYTGWHTVGAEDPIHSCTNSRDKASAWFRFTATFTGLLRLSTEGSDFDTVLAAYPAPTPTAQNQLACNDDVNAQNTWSQVSFAVTSGTTYLIQATAFNSLTWGQHLVLQARQDIACTYSIEPASANVGAAGGSGSFDLTTGAGCSWNAVSSAPWLSVNAPGSGSGSATIRYTVGTNGGPARNATITVGGQTFTVHQAAPAAAGADLTITAFTGPATGQPGGAINISVTVANQGTQNAGPFRVTFWVSTDNIITTNDIPTGWYCDYNGLLANSSSTCSGAIELPANLAHGVYFLGAIADEANTVPETNENNNTRPSASPIHVGGGGANQPPSATSVTPSSGSGSSATFSFVFNDPNGFTDIAVVQVIVNSALNAAGACFVEYQRGTNLLRLANDAATNWITPGTSPGGAASPENSQCQVSGATSSVSGNGTTLTLNLALAFKQAFGGAKQVFAFVQDQAGANSGWTQLGSWTVPGQNQPPQAVSVSPASGNGLTQTFTFLFSDAQGFQTLDTTYVLINSVLSGAGACFLEYRRAANLIRLANDSGTNWLPETLTPGAAGAVENSQCTVSGSGSSASGSAATLTLVLNLTFKQAFSGARAVFGFAVDTAGATSAWTQLGTWTVPGGANQPPQVLYVSPASGAGTTQAFTFGYADPNGFADLSLVYGLINNTLAATSACYFGYDRLNNVLRLANDNATNWVPGVIFPGGPGLLENSQCSIAGSTLQVSGFANNFVLIPVITFKAAFGGVKSLYGFAQDQSGASSAWTLLGSWTVPGSNSAPQVVSVNPASGSGTSQAFAMTYSDANGHADIRNTYLLVNAALNGAGACFLWFDRVANLMRLANDAGNNWVAGTVTPGSPGTVQNSQCTLSGTGSSASGSGNSFTVSYSLTFSGAFSGLKGLYGFVVDAQGATSTWLQAGTWAAGSNSAPSVGAAAPSSGSGSSATFALPFSDANGRDDISVVYLLMNGALVAQTGCFVEYNHAANLLRLANDGATAWSAPITPGSGATLENSQCRILGTASIGGTGNNLILNLPLQFKPAFAGARALFGFARDHGGLSSNWTQMGGWTVP